MLSVSVYTSVLGAPAKIYDVLEHTSDWRRSIRTQGGYWTGEFTITGNREELTKYFYNWLGYHVEERSGGIKTWEGMIYELDFTSAAGDWSVTRRRSLDDMYNSIQCTYTLTDGTPQTVGPYTNNASIAKYGRRGAKIDLPVGQYSAAAAQAYAYRYLKENSWPWARPIGVEFGQGESRLRVTVCGYVFTANWRYEGAGTGSADNISTWITTFINGYCDFLTVGNIQTNTLQVEPDKSARVYDTIMEYVKLGDANYMPWRFYVGNERKAYYESLHIMPDYYMRNGKLYGKSGSLIHDDPWRVTPGVVRDMNYSASGVEYGGWLANKSDFWIDEIVCSLSGGLSLTSSKYSESEMITAQWDYESQMQREGYEASIYTHYGYTARDWERLSIEQRRAWVAKWKRMTYEQRRTWKRSKKTRGVIG